MCHLISKCDAVVGVSSQTSPSSAEGMFGAWVWSVVSASHWSLYGHCSSLHQVLYRDASGKGTSVIFTPEMERVKRNQEQISSVFSQGTCVLKFMSNVTYLTAFFLLRFLIILTSSFHLLIIMHQNINVMCATIANFLLMKQLFMHFPLSCSTSVEWNKNTLHLCGPSVLIHSSTVAITQIFYMFYGCCLYSHLFPYFLELSDLRCAHSATYTVKQLILHLLFFLSPRCCTRTASVSRYRAKQLSYWTLLRWDVWGRLSVSSLG